MADTGFTSQPTPAHWGEAFARLPTASAPDDAWSRIATRLHGPGTPLPQRPRRRWRPMLAIAASLVLALPVAWWVSSRDGAAPSDMRIASGASDPAPAAATIDAGTASRPTNNRTGASIASDATEDDGTAALAEAPARGAVVAIGASAAPRPAQRTARMPTEAATASAEAGSARRLASHPAALPGGATPSAPDPGLASVVRLQQESARLEALVALARDDRMASAPATVMAATLDDRIRLIDAALTQGDLDVATRASLWSERVDTLQDLASLEGTRRWMAAHGASMDAVARVD